MRHSLPFLLLALSLSAPTAWAGAPLTDAVQVPRPAEGEYMGLYLQGKKVGYLFTHLSLSADKKRVTAVNELVFKAMVGTRTSERLMRDTRVYESKPKGRLISFTVEQKGDGGDQVLEATAQKSGLKVVRKRPGVPDELLTTKASQEVVEDADQARVALKRGATVEGMITDGTDLEQYKVTTTVEKPEKRTIRGVQVLLKKAVTLSEKEKVPTEAWVDEQGRMLEIHFGPTLTALSEPKEDAMRLDVVEVFGLTRVVLPKPAPPDAREVPGKLTLVIDGLPDKFHTSTYRQSYLKLKDGQVAVRLTASAPQKRSKLPLADPDGGENLKSSIIVESNAPAIKSLAKKIVGKEKDAWAAAKKIGEWVNKNLTKDYGSSSDRATDVLKTMKGDCTEHALLTTALLRSIGIPARRVDGVVYLVNDDMVPALYWHEWVEAYVGEWTQLDPTFGQDVADATHLGFGYEGNAEITPLIGSIKVTDVN